jgi:uncharacterized protein YjbI with pentapeptide repeats
MAQYRYKLALLAILAAPACAPADAEGPEALDPVAMRELEVVAANGANLNGANLNGANLNGANLNGSELVGTSGGTPVSGTGLVGAELQGQLSTGDSLTLRIDAARTSGGIWFYKVSYATTSGNQPLCGVDGGGAAVEAVAFDGRWDYRQGVSGGGAWINDSSSITFGCRGAVLAKCAELGYKPWAQSGSTALRPYHQACTRMMRADYCGDGTPHTVTGTPINLYDNLSIQSDSESWPIEAEWTDAGARFVTTTAADMRYQLLGGSAPACLSSLASSSAGNTSHFASGTLLMNEH